MSITTASTTTASTASSGTASTTGHGACDRATSTTKALLGYGVIAGPLYLAVIVVQAFARDGYDPARHQASLLAHGDFGWVQTANFVLTGLMTIAFALGLRRALRPGRGATWAPRLIGTYGMSLLGAAVFPADPVPGFPSGAPAEAAAEVSTTGMLHFGVAGIGFACLASACFVVARRYRDEGRRRPAVASRLVGAVFFTGFAAVASGGGSVAANLVFTAAVVTVCAWTAAVALDRYRRVGTR